MGRVFQDPSRGVCPSLTVLENMALADRKGRPYGLSWGVDKKRRGYYQQQLERLHLGLENRLGQKVGLAFGRPAAGAGAAARHHDAHRNSRAG